MRKRSISILDGKNSTSPILHAFLFFPFPFFRQRTRKIDYLAGGWWWFRCEDVKLKGDGNCEFKLYYSSNNRWEKDRFRYWMGRSSIGEEFWQDRRISWRTGEVILLVPLLRIFPPRIYLLTGEQMRNFPQILTETRLERIDVRNFLKNIGKIFPSFVRTNFHRDQIIPLWRRSIKRFPLLA